MRYCPRCGLPDADARPRCARCGAALPRSGSALKATVLAALAGGMIVASAIVLAITLAVHSATPDPLPQRAAGREAAVRPVGDASAATAPAGNKPDSIGRTLLTDPRTTQAARGGTAPTADRSSVPAARTDVARDPAKETVYVTRTGEKYHRDGCRYLRQSRIPMKLSEAKKMYAPCSVCRPPS